MTGQQHYQKAEDLLDFAANALMRRQYRLAAVRTLQAIAHALLANATATAWPGRDGRS